MADALNELLAQSAGKPRDIASAYFAISDYRLVQEGLHLVGAFRLLLGVEPHTGTDVGLRPNTEALKKRLQGPACCGHSGLAAQWGSDTMAADRSLRHSRQGVRACESVTSIVSAASPGT
jgi:hypothetical protein